jgi:hypothetical protein
MTVVVTIELIEAIERSFPVKGRTIRWPKGFQFRARRNDPEGYTVVAGPDAGLGIRSDCAQEKEATTTHYQ